MLLPTISQPLLFTHVTRAVSFIDAAIGEIQGYIAIWGSPEHRDAYGTFFDKSKPPDMALDFLPFPICYEHGMGKARKEIVGSVDGIWFDDVGIAFRGTLNRASKWFGKLVADIRAKRLRTSSATAGHIADFDDEGRFQKWYLTELSLTEHPAESNIPSVSLIRSAMGEPIQCHIACPPQAEGDRDGCDQRREGEPMSHLEVLMFPNAQVRALADLLAEGADGSLENVLQALIDEYGMDAVIQLLQQGQQPQAGGDTTMMSDATATGSTPTNQPNGANLPNPADSGAVSGQNVLEALAMMMAQYMQQPTEGRTRVPTPAGGVNLLTQQPNTNPVAQLLNQVRRQMQSAPPSQAGNGAAARSINPIPQRNPTRRAASGPNIQVMSKYQHLSAADMAMGYMLLESGMEKRLRGHLAPVSNEYLRAMSYKTAQMIEKGDAAASDFAVRSKFPFRSATEVFESDETWAIRANEVMTGANGQGGEWIYDLQGTTLWEKIRNEPGIYQQCRSKGMDESEIPQGYDGETIPLEGSDPVWYVASGASDEDSSGNPVATFATSKYGTGKKSVDVAKLSVAMDFRRELEEDSIINIAQEANRKIRVTSGEQIDYILINGDSVLTANTNINLIDGTPNTGTTRPAYTLLDGFLKLALVTNTSNARDADTAFNEVDFLKTLALMPSAMRQNRDRLLYIVDTDTGLAATNIPVLKTHDSYSRATIEEGVLLSIWRVDVAESGFMYLANANGKIPAAGGTRGRILLVRPDQWASRWKRRIQTEVTYYPRQDVTQVVAHMRWGVAYLDNEAAACTYNVDVSITE